MSATQKVQQHPAFIQAQDKANYYVNQLDKELSKYPILNSFEQRTQVPKSYAFIGAVVLLAILHSINAFASPVSNLVGWALPAFLSVKALESPGHADDVQWLTYWIVFGFFNFLESFALRIVLYYFPWYFAFKSLFILWLQLPQFRGAQMLYGTVVRPVELMFSNEGPRDCSWASTCAVWGPLSSMLSLYNLLAGLHDHPSLLHRLSLTTLGEFIRTTTSLKTSIVHEQPPSFDPEHVPAALPRRIALYIASRLELDEAEVDALWEGFGVAIWKGDSDLPREDAAAMRERFNAYKLSEHMLYPPVRICDRPYCTRPQLLRRRDDPAQVVLFTMDEGAKDGHVFHLYCYGCQTTYYPDYCVHRDTRIYYADPPPPFVQVSDSRYIENKVLQHFLKLMLLSWTSATNAAHIYHESLSCLPDDCRSLPRYRLRPEHVWDGFVINALLKDAQRRGHPLVVPHTGEQKDRFTDAMRARNDHIRRAGQPHHLL
ncbi:hypothetical protein NUW54_g9078 [Trametes sanguinea]|uniref:Uncharacterized protein n=1 Tax=Trametes sanguinea TaxID=158606 RepID=A0ACC1PBT8_9APHY|nr:hypothetical protein NUW54_g9078 [Trametes sanguinea]